MTPRTRRWLAALALVCIAAAVLFVGAPQVARSFRPEAPEPPAPVVRAPDEPAPVRALGTACTLPKPLVLDGRYAVAFTSRATFASGAQAPATEETPATTAFEGTLEAKPGEEHDGVREVALRLSLRVVDVSEASARLGEFGPAAGLSATFGQPFAMRVGRDGMLEEARFAEAMPMGIQSLLHLVAETAQVTWPEGCETGAAWTAEERQLNGAVQVSYTRSGEALRKRFVGEGDGGVYRVDGSATLAVQDDRFEEIEQEATTRVALDTPNGQLRADANARLRLRRLADATLASSEGPRLTPLDLDALGRKAQRSLDKASVAGRDFSALVDDLEVAGALGFVARGQARNDLQALLRLDRSKAEDVGMLLMRGVPDATLQRSLLEALTATREGSAVLARLFLSRERPSKVRRDAVTASTFAAEPTGSLASALVEAQSIPPLRIGAIIAEGAVVGSLYLLEDPEAPALGNAFLDRASAALPPEAVGPRSGPARSLDEVIAWIQAVAVTRQDAALELLARALGDEDAWIRAQAAAGLRYFPNDRAVELIAGVLANDRDPGAREQALVAARELGRGRTLDLVRRSLVSDEVSWVRLAAADAIGAWALYRPGLRTILQEAVADETDEAVRESMLNYITPGRGLENAQRLDPWADVGGGSP